MKGGSDSESEDKWEDALAPPSEEGEECSERAGRSNRLCGEGLRCVLYPHSVTGTDEQIQAGIGQCVREPDSLELVLKPSKRGVRRGRPARPARRGY